MMKRFTPLCALLLLFANQTAFGQQSRTMVSEPPAVSLCQLIGKPDFNRDKIVRVEATVEAVYLYSYIIGLTVTGPDCDPVTAHFKRYEDEEAVIDAMCDSGRDRVRATMIGKLSLQPWKDSERDYGLMGMPKYRLTIESITVVKPIR
jgi:hypothetical protein